MNRFDKICEQFEYDSSYAPYLLLVDELSRVVDDGLQVSIIYAFKDMGTIIFRYGDGSLSMRIDNRDGMISGKGSKTAPSRRLIAWFEGEWVAGGAKGLGDRVTDLEVVVKSLKEELRGDNCCTCGCRVRNRP